MRFVNGAAKDRYTPSKRTIYWDHRGGGVFKYKKCVNSAALALAHEMGHVAQHINGQLTNDREKIEAANLKKHEIPIARQLGEPIRKDYKEISGSRRMNNSTHYITLHQYPYKPWKSYICHHNQWPVVGTTIGPA